MKEWVGHELKGYPNRDTLPPYRVLPVTVLANLSNGVVRYTDHPLPMPCRIIAYAVTNAYDIPAGATATGCAWRSDKLPANPRLAADRVRGGMQLPDQSAQNAVDPAMIALLRT